jgi:hypothetical protein
MDATTTDLEDDIRPTQRRRHRFAAAALTTGLLLTTATAGVVAGHHHGQPGGPFPIVRTASWSDDRAATTSAI